MAGNINKDRSQRGTPEIPKTTKRFLLGDLPLNQIYSNVFDLSARTAIVESTKQTDGSTLFKASITPVVGLEVIDFLSACSGAPFNTFNPVGFVVDWIELYAAYRKAAFPDENWRLTDNAKGLLLAHQQAPLIGDNNRRGGQKRVSGNNSHGFSETMAQLEPFIQHGIFATLFQTRDGGGIHLINEKKREYYLLSEAAEPYNFTGKSGNEFFKSLEAGKFSAQFLEFVAHHPLTDIPNDQKESIRILLEQRKQAQGEEIWKLDEAISDLVQDFFSGFGFSSHAGIFRHVLSEETRMDIFEDFLAEDEDREKQILRHVIQQQSKKYGMVVFDPQTGSLIAVHIDPFTTDVHKAVRDRVTIGFDNSKDPEMSWPYPLTITLSHLTEDGKYVIADGHFSNTPNMPISAGIPVEISWTLNQDGSRRILSQGTTPLGVGAALLYSPTVHETIPPRMPYVYSSKAVFKQEITAAQAIRNLVMDSPSPDGVHLREDMQNESPFFSALEKQFAA